MYDLARAHGCGWSVRLCWIKTSVDQLDGIGIVGLMKMPEIWILRSWLAFFALSYGGGRSTLQIPVFLAIFAALLEKSIESHETYLSTVAQEEEKQAWIP